MVEALIILAIINVALAIIGALKDIFKNFTKGAAISTIIIVVIGFAITIYTINQQDTDDKLTKDTLGGIKRRVDDSKIEAEKLLLKADSSNRRIERLLADRNDLISQYERVNNLLKGQVETENRLFRAGKPQLALYPEDNSWDIYRDSTKLILHSIVSNLGSRNCTVTETIGRIYFLTDDMKPFFCIPIDSSKEQDPIEPRAKGVGLHIFSQKYFPRKVLFGQPSIALIYLRVAAFDDATKSDISKDFYYIWAPEFGFQNASIAMKTKLKSLLQKYPNKDGQIDEKSRTNIN